MRLRWKRFLGVAAVLAALSWFAAAVVVSVGVISGAEPVTSGALLAGFALTMMVGSALVARDALRPVPLKERLLDVPEGSLIRVDHDTTIEFLRAVRQGVPERAAAADRCHELLREGRFEDCVGALEELMELFPEESVFALTTIGECLFMLGEYENSIAYFHRAAEAGVGYDGMSDHISEAEEMLAADDVELFDDSMLDATLELPREELIADEGWAVAA